MSEISKLREYEKEKKIQDRLDRLTNLLFVRKNKEINFIKHKLRRELRKLYKKQQQKSEQFKRDIIKEHSNPSSELYAPQMRYGEHPKRRHEVIEKESLGETCIESKYRYISIKYYIILLYSLYIIYYIVLFNYTDIIEINTLPSWLSTYEELSAIEPRSKSADLCIRATRWTKEKLSQLHSDLKANRLNTETIEIPLLLKRKYKLPSPPLTPYKTSTENIINARLHQLSMFIQKIIRGRAIQCMVIIRN